MNTVHKPVAIPLFRTISATIAVTLVSPAPRVATEISSWNRAVKPARLSDQVYAITCAS